MTPTERIALLEAAVRFVQLVHVPEMRGADGYSIRAGYLLALAEDGSMWTGEEHGYGPWVCTRTIADRLRAPEGEAVGGAQAPPYAAVNEAFDAARGSHPTLRAVMAERPTQSPPADEPSEDELQAHYTITIGQFTLDRLKAREMVTLQQEDGGTVTLIHASDFPHTDALPLSAARAPTQEQIAEIIQREYHLSPTKWGQEWIDNAAREIAEIMREGLHLPYSEHHRIPAVAQEIASRLAPAPAPVSPPRPAAASDAETQKMIAANFAKAAERNKEKEAMKAAAAPPPIPASLIARAQKIEARWRLGPYDHNADITDLVRDIAALGAGGGEA